MYKRVPAMLERVTGSLWRRCSKSHTTENESGPIRFEREMGTPTCVHRFKVYLLLFTLPFGWSGSQLRAFKRKSNPGLWLLICQITSQFFFFFSFSTNSSNPHPKTDPQFIERWQLKPDNIKGLKKCPLPLQLGLCSWKQRPWLGLQ